MVEGVYFYPPRLSREQAASQRSQRITKKYFCNEDTKIRKSENCNFVPSILCYNNLFFNFVIFCDFAVKDFVRRSSNYGFDQNVKKS
jgi:hypothetical protein